MKGYKLRLSTLIKICPTTTISTIFSAIFLGLAQVFLLFGFFFTQPALAESWLVAASYSEDHSSTLQRGADQAEKASDQIYEGLDTTKRIIGKTDERNQIIQAGREKASKKLEDLADKARSAQETGESLPPQEQKTIERLQQK